VGERVYPGVWADSYYTTYPVYGPPPVYLSNSTTAYVEREQQATQPYYWYYCAEPKGYYPYIQNCNDAWLPVVPQR
jgi:hypothetical protein